MERESTESESERDWTCETVRPLLPAAAIGALDRKDGDAVARHLLECRACRLDLDRFADTVDLIGFAAPQLQPPPSLKATIFREIDQKEPRRLPSRLAWVASLAAALLALLLAGNLALELHLFDSGSSSPTPTTQVGAASQPPLVWFDLTSASTGSTARGTLCAQDGGGLAWLIVENLPQPPSGMTYQVWLTGDDQRISAGTFSVDAQGRGFLTIHLSQPIDRYSLIGVTDEPMGGSPEPTGPRILGVSL